MSGLVARFHHDHVTISYDSGATETSLMMPSSIHVNDGNWHYVALVWDTDKEVSLRVDTVFSESDDGGTFEELPE